MWERPASPPNPSHIRPPGQIRCTALTGIPLEPR